MTHMRITCMLAGVFAMVAGLASADFQFEVNYGNRTTDHTGAFLTGSTNNPSVGFFVECFYAGPNGVIDLPPLDGGGSGNYVFQPRSVNPKGEYGDDVRMAYAHYGLNPFFLGIDGNFQSDAVVVNDLTNGLYYVRAWEAPSPDYATGQAPFDPPATFFFGVSTVRTNFPALGGSNSNPPAPFDMLSFGQFSTDLAGIISEEFSIACPADITVECDESTQPDNTGFATVTPDIANVSTNFTDASTQDPDTVECEHYNYEITRTWVADDGAGNTSACVQTITVQDASAPDITPPPDVTIECDETTAPAHTGTASASDECDAAPNVSFSDSVGGGSCPVISVITRTWVATDACGNTSDTVQTITLEDTTAPSLSVPDDVTIACGDLTDPSNTGTATAADNCGGASDVSFSDSLSGTCPLESVITRTWTAEDSCGNSISGVQTILIQDILPPTVTSVEINAELTDPDDLAGGPQPSSWALQRSDLRSLTITFSEPVAPITAGDLTLTNLGVDTPADDDTGVPLTDGQLTLSPDGLTLTILFTPEQLTDGVHELIVHSTVTDLAGNPLDGNGNGVGGDDFVYTGDATNRFFELAGDWNGNAGVNILDFATFAYWFGIEVPDAPEYADTNNSGGVNILDFAAFANNFGISVVFPDAP